jgi:polyisoprenoid-binding protein YceI
MSAARKAGGFALLAVVASFGLCALAAPAPPPAILPHGQPDARKATAGVYSLDPAHTAVIARVSHLGFSMSVFRFGKVAATLRWDPLRMERSSLSASVETSSIETPVPGFAAQLRGKDYLNAAKNPRATFVSTAFRPRDEKSGVVEGRLTLMGRTLPASFEVRLVGAGPGFAAGPVIGHVLGVHALTHVDPKAIGLPSVFHEPIEISIDAEFAKKS